MSSSREHKVLAVLHGDLKTPPLSLTARTKVGWLLRQLQRGSTLSLPHSRAMPDFGPRCHELRVNDESQTWRIIYRIDTDAIVVGDVFSKKTPTTPQPIIAACRKRYQEYDNKLK